MPRELATVRVAPSINLIDGKAKQLGYHLQQESQGDDATQDIAFSF
jgi:hypothetical protein